jgi:alcohol sulfotransferase
VTKLGRALRDAVDGWQRQRKAVRKLRACDVAVVSAAKSGRTWLAVMISHVYHQRSGVPENLIIRFDNFSLLNPDIPIVFFTHDTQRIDRATPLFGAKHFHGVKTVLLVRDPRDTAVSAYFNHFRDLEKPRPGRPFTAPDHSALVEYVLSNRLPRLIEFLQRWRGQLSDIDRHLLVRYEDLRSNPQSELAKVMTFIDDSEPAIEEIAKAVEFAAFENLRQKEASHFFSADILKSWNPSDPNGFKVRRAKIGGYRDYFTMDDLSQIERLMQDAGLEALGYAPHRVTGSAAADGPIAAATPSAAAGL